jgi:hypothetical protein
MPCGVRWRSVGYCPRIGPSLYKILRLEDLDLWRTGNWSHGAKYGLQFCVRAGFELKSGVRLRVCMEVSLCCHSAYLAKDGKK